MNNIINEEFNTIIRNVVNDVLLEKGLIVTEPIIKTEEIIQPSYNIVDEVISSNDNNLSKQIYKIIYNMN